MPTQHAQIQNSKLDQVEADIRALPFSPSANALKEKVEKGEFRDWLAKSLANNGQLEISRDDWKRACESHSNALDRRSFLRVVPLLAGGTGALAATGTYSLTENMLKGPLQDAFNKQSEALMVAVDQYGTAPDDTQLAKVKTALESCKKAKKALDEVDMSEMRNICTTIGIGTLGAGVIGYTAIVTGAMTRLATGIGEEFSPAYCVARLQAKLDANLAKNHPDLYEEFIAARNAQPNQGTGAAKR